MHFGVHGFCFADGTFSSSCSCSHLSFDSTNSTFTTEESQHHIINLHWRRLQGRGLPVQVGDTGTVFLRCWGVRDEMSGNIWHGRSAAYIIAASIRIQYLDQFPWIFSEVTMGSFCIHQLFVFPSYLLRSLRILDHQPPVSSQVSLSHEWKDMKGRTRKIHENPQKRSETPSTLYTFWSDFRPLKNKQNYRQSFRSQNSLDISLHLKVRWATGETQNGTSSDETPTVLHLHIWRDVSNHTLLVDVSGNINNNRRWLGHLQLLTMKLHLLDLLFQAVHLERRENTAKRLRELVGQMNGIVMIFCGSIPFHLTQKRTFLWKARWMTWMPTVSWSWPGGSLSLWEVLRDQSWKCHCGIQLLAVAIVTIVGPPFHAERCPTRHCGQVILHWWRNLPSQWLVASFGGVDSGDRWRWWVVKMFNATTKCWIQKWSHGKVTFKGCITLSSRAATWWLDHETTRERLGGRALRRHKWSKVLPASYIDWNLNTSRTNPYKSKRQTKGSTKVQLKTVSAHPITKCVPYHYPWITLLQACKVKCTPCHPFSSHVETRWKLTSRQGTNYMAKLWCEWPFIIFHPKDMWTSPTDLWETSMRCCFFRELWACLANIAFCSGLNSWNRGSTVTGCMQPATRGTCCTLGTALAVVWKPTNWSYTLESMKAVTHITVAIQSIPHLG